MSPRRTRKNRSRSGALSANSVAPSVRERLKRVILSDLTMQERLLLVLAYAERMSPVEIGDALDMAPKQVETIRERIVARLGLELGSAEAS